MGDRCGIAHSIDVRHRGFHPLVDSDAVTNIKLESGLLCQMRVRRDTDGKKHHIRIQRCAVLQQGQYGISCLAESGYCFSQPQRYAMRTHFCVNKACHIRIQRCQKLVRTFDDCYRDPHSREVFCHFQSDEATTCQHRAFWFLFLCKLSDAARILYRTQGKNSFVVNTGKRRDRRLCAGGQEEFIIAFRIDLFVI